MGVAEIAVKGEELVCMNPAVLEGLFRPLSIEHFFVASENSVEGVSNRHLGRNRQHLVVQGLVQRVKSITPSFIRRSPAGGWE